MMSLRIFACLFVLASAQSGAGYDKYMKQYAGDYSQYMSQGDSSSSTGGYDKYSKEYAGDYSKYMSQGGGGEGYDKYMKQYAGEYSKYMSQEDKKDHKGEDLKVVGQVAESSSLAATILLRKDVKSKDDEKSESFERLQDKAHQLKQSLEDETSREADREVDDTARAAARVEDDKARQELKRVEEDQSEADKALEQDKRDFAKRAQSMQKRIKDVAEQINATRKEDKEGHRTKDSKVADLLVEEGVQSTSLPILAMTIAGAGVMLLAGIAVRVQRMRSERMDGEPMDPVVLSAALLAAKNDAYLPDAFQESMA